MDSPYSLPLLYPPPSFPRNACLKGLVSLLEICPDVVPAAHRSLVLPREPIPCMLCSSADSGVFSASDIPDA